LVTEKASARIGPNSSLIKSGDPEIIPKLRCIEHNIEKFFFAGVLLRSNRNKSFKEVMEAIEKIDPDDKIAELLEIREWLSFVPMTG
jgi:hypothetical protein